MPATVNKQRLLSQLLAVPTPHEAGPSPEPEPLPVLEQLLYAVCREGTTRDRADQAFKNLRERFFDWNEIRVSSVREVEEALSPVPCAEARAQRIIGILQQVFEETYSFDLEVLHKKGLKNAARQLARYQSATDYSVAWVVQQTLGGHAVPVDTHMLRVLRRLGLVDADGQDMESLRASLEHLVPKAKGSAFVDVLSMVAEETCHDRDPQCDACPLHAECVTGQERRHTGELADRVSRPKPR